MEKGYLMPMAKIQGLQFTEIVEYVFLTVMFCKQKNIIKQKDGKCAICGKPILKKEKCLFANLRLTEDPKRPCGCVDVYLNAWWHPECELLPIKDRMKILQDGIKNGSITDESSCEI